MCNVKKKLSFTKQNKGTEWRNKKINKKYAGTKQWDAALTSHESDQNAMYLPQTVVIQFLLSRMATNEMKT